jgi:hypothetical protein
MGRWAPAVNNQACHTRHHPAGGAGKRACERRAIRRS